MTSSTTHQHRIEIHYCVQCRWMLRASWMAQELLTTFDGDIEALTLRPGTGGVFDVSLDGSLLWSRKGQGRFPEITELKQRVRDAIDPARDLGHIDRSRAPGASGGHRETSEPRDSRESHEPRDP